LARIKLINLIIMALRSASVVYCPKVMGADPEVRVRFPALQDFLRSSGSGTEFTQPREYN
jgi:hypothetical protein